MKIFLFSVLVLLLGLIAVLFAIGDRPAQVGAIELAADTTVSRVEQTSELASEGNSATVDTRAVANEARRESPSSPRSARVSDANVPTTGRFSGRISVLHGAGGNGILTLHLESPGSAGESTSLRSWTRRDRSVDVQTGSEFDVTDLELGTWLARCTLADRAPSEARFVVSKDEPCVSHDFVLEARWALLVRLLDTSGRPLIEGLEQKGSKLGELIGAVATAAEPKLGDGSLADARAFAGRARVYGKGDPWCAISFDAMRSQSVWIAITIGERVIARQRALPGESDLTIMIATEDVLAGTGTLRVAVVDDLDSSPQLRASIALPRTAGNVCGSAVDAEGRARFDNLLPGSVQVSVRCESYVAWDGVIAIEAGRASDLTVRLERATTISGVVRDPSGHPLRVRLRAVSVRADDASPKIGPYRNSSLADGSFTFESVARREYVIVQDHADEPDSIIRPFTRDSVPPGATYVDARLGSVTGVIVTLDPADALEFDVHGKRAAQSGVSSVRQVVTIDSPR